MWALLLFLLPACAAADSVPQLRCHAPLCRYAVSWHRGVWWNPIGVYLVEGNHLKIMYERSSGYLSIECSNTKVLDSPALPRADAALKVWNVYVINCQLPSTGSLADTLAKLNVKMLFNESNAHESRGNLYIKKLTSKLNAAHFTGLDRLTSLDITADVGAQNHADSSFLAPLKSLRSLTLEDVKLGASVLDASHPSLRELTLINTGVKRLPAAVYLSPSLVSLTVESDGTLDAAPIPPKLRSLHLRTSATSLLLDDVSALEELVLTDWMVRQPQPLTRCDNLRKLRLIAPAVNSLPHDWLANCSKLEELVIENAQKLTSLPLLFGGFHSHLKLVALKTSALETLSEGQFKNASALITLQLSSNRLRTIPRGSLPSSLKNLDLSFNNLDGDVLNSVAAAGCSLIELNLNNNPRLGDACDTKGYSPLRRMKNLTKLYLNKTNVTHICQDWRKDMLLLKTLDLSNTRLSTLTFEDLQFSRTKPATVLLQGTAVTSLELSVDDFRNVSRAPKSNATVYLDRNGKLECNCRMFWTRWVLDSFPHALEHVKELRCVGGRLLREHPAENMFCSRPEMCAAAALPAKCACAVRPDMNLPQYQQLVLVNCEYASLDHVPVLPSSEENIYELRLAHNSITDFHASDLHDKINILDLRHNSISTLDDEAVTKLSTFNGMLRLAGNPLDCDCSAAPLLRALHNYHGYNDLTTATCSDGRAVSAAPLEDCPSLAPMVCGLMALFIVIVCIIVYFSSRDNRLLVKAMLNRFGLWCTGIVEDQRTFDIFLAYSLKDEAIAYAITSRLEPPYRVCMHDRNWMPGLSVEDLIVESVHSSHRTIALVSREYLASPWMSVEYREAYMAKLACGSPRLIIVFLEDPMTLPLTPQLQDYMDIHTCLRWGDPWFYFKLAVVLPRPRRPSCVMDRAPFITSTPYARSRKEAAVPLLTRAAKFVGKRTKALMLTSRSDVQTAEDKELALQVYDRTRMSPDVVI